jgi:hypothetical protein
MWMRRVRVMKERIYFKLRKKGRASRIEKEGTGLLKSPERCRKEPCSHKISQVVPVTDWQL